MNLTYKKRYIAGVEGESKGSDGRIYTCFKLFAEHNTLKTIKKIAVETAKEAGRRVEVYDHKHLVKPTVFEYDPNEETPSK